MKNILMFLTVTLLLLIASCSSIKEWTKDVFEPASDMDAVQESHRPLAQQRLIPRQGYEGHLTNRVCLSWYGDKCEKESVRKYSIKDKETRTRLIELGFACRVGGKRYRVCPDRAGFCRREKHETCLKWGRTLIKRKKVCRKKGEDIINKFISVDDYAFLLDGATECKKGM